MIESITKWEELTPYLDLDEVEVEDIKETRSSPRLRRIEYLLSGSKRMERKLLTEPWSIKVFAYVGRRDLAKRVCEMIQDESCSSSEDHKQHGGVVCKTLQSATSRYSDHFRGVCQPSRTSLSYSY